MAKKKAKPLEEVEKDLYEDMEETYDQCMADVYDILMDTYDKIGVRVKELLEAEEYAVDEDDEEYYDDPEYEQ